MCCYVTLQVSGGRIDGYAGITMGKQSVEKDLVDVLRRHKDGIEAEKLRLELQELGHTSEVIRAALQHALNTGHVQLGRELRVLEAA
jgi:hypothetical protein